MFLALLIFILCLVLAARDVIAIKNIRRKEEPVPLSLQRVYLGARILLFLSLGIAFISGAGSDPFVFTTSIILLLVSVAVLLVAQLFRNYATTVPTLSTRRLVYIWCKSRVRRAKVTWSEHWSLIAPPGSGADISFRVRSIDRLLSAGTFIRGYLLVFPVAIVLALIVVIATLLNPGDEIAPLFSVIVGYNALFNVSLMTLIVFFSTGICMVMRYAGIIRFPLHLDEMPRRIATSVGYGTLLGFLIASLIPFVSAIFQSLSPGIELTYVPSLLIEIPALSAVLGYYWGLILTIISLAKGSRSLLYRYVVVPGFTMLLIYMSSAWVLSPDFLAQMLTAGTQYDMSEDICRAPIESYQAQNILADPLWLLLVIEGCNDTSVIMSGASFAVTHILLLGIASACAFVVNLSRRKKEREESHPIRPSEVL